MMSPDEKLFAAIFGPRDEAEAKKMAKAREEAKARQLVADKKRALEICKLARQKCSILDAVNAEWLPALVYDIPAAVAILDSGDVIQAHPEVEGYAKLKDYDIKQTEVFND